jgi:hypothetical protein
MRAYTKLIWRSLEGTFCPSFGRLLHVTTDALLYHRRYQPFKLVILRYI